MVSACMAAPVRKAAALPSAPAAAAAASCSLRCSSSQAQRSVLTQLRSSSSVSRCRMQRLGMRALATAAVETRQGPPAPPKDQVLTQDPANNVTEYIYSKMGVNLHHQPSHPIGIIKQVRSLGWVAKVGSSFKHGSDEAWWRLSGRRSGTLASCAWTQAAIGLGSWLCCILSWECLCCQSSCVTAQRHP